MFPALSLLLFAAPAHAGDAVLGANTLAAGSAVAADGYDNAGITVNPGLIALHQRYDFHAHLGYGAARGLGWGASVVDARTSEVVALGFAYAGDKFSPELTDDEAPGWVPVGATVTNVKRNHDFTLALAGQLFERKLSLGLAGNLGTFNHDRGGSGVQGDMDAGVGIVPHELVTIGLSAQNVLPLEGSTGRDMRFLGGVRLENDTAGGIEFDGGYAPEARDNPLLLSAGGEAMLASGRLRAGWRLDDAVNHLTAGLGVQTAGGAFEYAFEMPLVAGVGLGSTLHTLGIRFGAPAPIPEE